MRNRYEDIPPDQIAKWRSAHLRSLVGSPRYPNRGNKPESLKEKIDALLYRYYVHYSEGYNDGYSDSEDGNKSLIAGLKSRCIGLLEVLAELSTEGTPYLLEKDEIMEIVRTKAREAIAKFECDELYE